MSLNCFTGVYCCRQITANSEDPACWAGFGLVSGRFSAGNSTTSWQPTLQRPQQLHWSSRRWRAGSTPNNRVERTAALKAIDVSGTWRVVDTLDRPPRRAARAVCVCRKTSSRRRSLTVWFSESAAGGQTTCDCRQIHADALAPTWSPPPPPPPPRPSARARAIRKRRTARPSRAASRRRRRTTAITRLSAEHSADND